MLMEERILEKKINMKKWMYFISCIVVYWALISIPTPEGLTIEGQKSLAIMVVAVIVWVSEIVPIGIASALLPMLTAILNIYPVGATLKEFTTPTIFFMMSAMIISVGFTDSGIGERISLIVSFIFGASPKRVLLSFMVFTAAVSAILVDIPTAIIFSSIAYSLLQKNNCLPGESNFGKAIMMGIPISSAIGGFATPVGSGINIQTINTLKTVAGIEINFMQWSAIGVPMAVILVIVSWFILCRMVPPEMDIVKGAEDIEEAKKKLGTLKVEEKKFIVIFGITLLVWITQPLTKFDNTLAAMICAAALAFPGIGLVTWEKAKARVSWDSLLLVGSATSLAMVIWNTGAAQWIADGLFNSVAGLNVTLVLLVVAIFGIVSHLLLPVASAVIAVVVPIMASVAMQMGINPAFLVLPIGYTASCVFLLPLDPIPLTTFGYKYWKLQEMSKIGIVISLAWIPLLVVFMLIGNAVGII